MAGLNSTLYIARSAINAQQLGLNVAGQNISNVNNDSFSRQSVQHVANSPILYGGHLVGNGVTSDQIERTADQLLEDRLTDQNSELSASDAFVAYMNVIQGLFNESSESSLSSLLPDYWNSWQDLSNSPGGASERLSVYENGLKVAEQFDYLNEKMMDMEVDLTREIEAAIGDVNRISEEIAKVNQEIIGLEGQRTANDQRDYRNSLVNELGKLVDVKTYEQENGSLTVTTANGFALVSGVGTYDLAMEEGSVKWESSSGGLVDITDRITGGAIGGWLDIRDEILPEYEAELDVLAKEFIWSVNYTHSQGVGTSYFDTPLTGTYKADETGLLSLMAFGDKIDYTKDFKMWVKNDGTSTPTYEDVQVDMGISDAGPVNWTGTEPSGEAARYEFTVIREGMTGQAVAVTDASGMGAVQIGSTVSEALNGLIADQTLTITNSDGTRTTIELRDSGGDAQRSAASIAEALRGIDGIETYGIENSVEIDISGLIPGAADAHENDEVSFELVSGDVSETVSFLVGADAAATQANFQTALDAVVGLSGDLSVTYDAVNNTATVTSASGENVGVENFDVEDNATITIDNFTQDAAGAEDSSFEIAGIVISYTLDTSGGQAAAANNLMTGLNNSAAALNAAGISWALNGAGTGVVISGSNQADIDITNLTSATGGADGFTVNWQAGTSVNGNPVPGSVNLRENGATGATVASVITETDTLGFGGSTLTESGGAGSDSGVKTSSLTLFMSPGMSIQSDVAGAAGGVFNTAANTDAPVGNSIITLGGDGGFADFDPGNLISFDVDGVTVNYTVGAADDTDLEFAAGLEAALGAAGLDPAVYSVSRAGASVSIIKSDGTAIDITNFNDDGAGGGAPASLRAVTGTGYDGEHPQSTILVSGGADSVSSALYDSAGVIEWRKYDAAGDFTGVTGIIDIQDAGPYTVEGNLTFDLDPGRLVAGNTFTVNTNTSGVTDPLDVTAKGTANSIMDTYKFTVKAPGGEVGIDDVEIEWSNGTSSGTFKLKAQDPPFTPLYADVDGMRLAFDSGYLFEDDVFVISTDEQGLPDVQLDSDWHWTMESFTDQFNRQAPGIKARVNQENQVVFEVNDRAYDVSDVGCSGVDGFCDVNKTITVEDYTALDRNVLDFQLARDAAGNWSINNDYTNGVAALVPPGGDDSGFGIDLTGDGVPDLKIDFDEPVTGSGYVEFDITRRNSEDLSFAFSGDDGNDSGLAAALGVNTFFTGDDAMTIDVNGVLDDTKYIAAATIDEETGEFTAGDNSNALAISELQYETLTLQEWTFERGENPESNEISSTVENYYHAMVGSIGVKAQNELRTQEFNQIMVNQLSTQRDSISAVSLDEEMINLMKYQHAYTAAAKLLTVADEMLNTLVSMR